MEAHPFEEYNARFHSELEEIILAGKRPTLSASCPPSYTTLVSSALFFFFSRHTLSPFSVIFNHF